MTLLRDKFHQTLANEMQEEQALVTQSEQIEQEEPILGENEAIINGYRCVFKPYFKGYKDSVLVVIPVKKRAFDSFSQNKQEKILDNAIKKFQKKHKID